MRLNNMSAGLIMKKMLFCITSVILFMGNTHVFAGYDLTLQNNTPYPVEMNVAYISCNNTYKVMINPGETGWDTSRGICSLNQINGYVMAPQGKREFVYNPDDSLDQYFRIDGPDAAGNYTVGIATIKCSSGWVVHLNNLTLKTATFNVFKTQGNRLIVDEKVLPNTQKEFKVCAYCPTKVQVILESGDTIEAYFPVSAGACSDVQVTVYQNADGSYALKLTDWSNKVSDAFEQAAKQVSKGFQTAGANIVKGFDALGACSELAALTTARAVQWAALQSVLSGQLTDGILATAQESAIQPMIAARKIAEQTLRAATGILDASKAVATGTLEAAKQTSRGVLLAGETVSVGVLIAADEVMKAALETFDIQHMRYEGSLQELAKGNLGNVRCTAIIVKQNVNFIFDLNIKDPLNSIKNLANIIADSVTSIAKQMGKGLAGTKAHNMHMHDDLIKLTLWYYGKGNELRELLV